MLDIEDVIATCRKSTGIDEIIDRIDDYEYRINIAGDQETRINIISTSPDIAKALKDAVLRLGNPSEATFQSIWSRVTQECGFFVQRNPGMRDFSRTANCKSWGTISHD